MRLRSLLSGAFGHGAAGALVALMLAWGAWHAYTDHVAHHRMLTYWNTYGPVLERARQHEPVPPPTRREPAQTTPATPSTP